MIHECCNDRCSIDKLFNAGHACVTVHALGMACQRAVNVCLKYQATMVNAVQIDVHTESVRVTDDVLKM